MSEQSDREALIDIEKSFLSAYRRKDVAAFLANMGDDYVGIAGEGVMSADDEIAKMQRFELRSVRMTDELVSFPSDGVGLIVYRMLADGKADGREVSVTIFTSSVYVRRDGAWKAVLHTESVYQ